MKFQKNTALRFWLPMTRKDLPAVQAALGYKGIYKGNDVRNVDVYAFISPISGTNWFIVAKIEESELLKGLYSEAVLIFILIILAIILVGTVISFFYNNQQKNIYKELYNREKELWQSEEKFKVTLESFGDGVITTDTSGKIQYLNKRAEELTGFTLLEAKGKKLSEVYYAKNEQTGERENNIIDKVLKQGIIKELGNHTILVSRDGKNIPVRDSGAPIFDSDGLLIGLVLTFQDETEKRFQINLLKESEEKYRTVVEIASDAIFINLNDSIVFVNNAAIELFGAKSSEQIIGKSPFEFFHPIYHEKAKERINLMIERGVRYSNIEEKIIRLDGKIIDVEVSAINFIYKDSLAFQVVLRDITKRKRIEEQREMAVTALRESEDRYFQLLNTAPIGILVVSEERITFVNPAAIHLFGANSNEQVLDKLLIDFVHPDNRETVTEQIVRLIKGEKNLYPVENVYIKMDGTPINLEVLVTPLMYQGKYAIQILLNDITDRKKMINDLIAAKEKAEEINKVKSNFFANMSHELRTPFVGIMGYAELLMESLAEPEYKEMAEGILSTSKRMKDTLTKILNLSKYEFSGVEINPKIIDIKTIINDIYKQFVKAAEKKNLLFRTKLCTEPINIETDDSILTEILNNLINNSIIYTDTGIIEISAEKQIKDNNRIVLIKVSDTGIGIPKNKQDIIWEEFRQVSEGTTRSYQGTGLGLTIAKKYTNLLGGNIYVESEEGKGSTFFLELPISSTIPLQNTSQKNYENNNKSVVFDSIEEINFSKKNILCVEDDLIARDVIKLALSKTYNIELAKDAENALALIREKNFDALMIDINLGKGINGLELTEKIKEIPYYKNTPVIAVTAYASEDDKNEFLSKGMSHYISKPFLIKDLLKLLEEVFSHR